MDMIMEYIQNMDITLILIFTLIAIAICGIFVSNKSKNDTVQHKGQPISHNIKKECFNSHIPINGSNQNSTNLSVKLHDARYVNKLKGEKNKNTMRQSTTHLDFRRSPEEIKNWFRKDKCHNDVQYTSSSVEGNIMSFCNSSSRDYSSSNDDLCSMYLIQKKSQKKEIKSRQKKRRQPLININTQTKDVDETSKENINPNEAKSISTNAALNLRKQCIKGVTLTTVSKNIKLSKSFTHDLGSNVIDAYSYSSISSASSTTSIISTVSSSASSSPSHSASSSPTASPCAGKRNTEYLKKSFKHLTLPLRQFIKLNMNENELLQQIKRYVIDPSLLSVYGFPVESVDQEGHIVIYKCLPKHLAEEAVTKDNQRHHHHFYGRRKFDIVNKYDDLYTNSCSQQWYGKGSTDSGRGSGDSSPRFTDSDSSEMGEDDTISPVMAFYTPDGVYQIFSEYNDCIEKQCVRCSKIFQVNAEGEYLTFDSCAYHWGKLNNVYNGKCYVNIYSCCQGEEASEGCSQNALHVWNGVVVGINGPYADFVHTQYSETKHHKHPKIYAIDCEMSYTGLGLEVTKVTVVGYDGSMVYNHFVRPQTKIIDYNTRFSGVSENDLFTDSNKPVKTFAEVQKDLLDLFDADTILIGHGLENDLRVLRLVHKMIVDTSVIFSHSTGYPYRRSLKNLSKSFLKRDIQCSDMGHSSLEDSRACLELMMWKIRKDLRHWNYL